MIEIDDFYTHADVVAGLAHLLKEIREEVSIFVLLGMSNRFAMLDILEKEQDFPLYRVGVHGWNHFSEPGFGYWEMRHLLEFAISWNCFDDMIVMPWNRMPKLGALRAIREKEYTLCTLYEWQRIVATLLGCNSIDLKPEMLLHPPDLLDRNRLDQIIEELNEKDTD